MGGSWDVAGGRQLVVGVTARAVDGAATEAVLAAVASAFGVHRRAVRLVSGRVSRTKVVEVDVEKTGGAALLRRLLERDR